MIAKNILRLSLLGMMTVSFLVMLFSASRPTGIVLMACTSWLGIILVQSRGSSLAGIVLLACSSCLVMILMLKQNYLISHYMVDPKERLAFVRAVECLVPGVTKRFQKMCSAINNSNSMNKSSRIISTILSTTVDNHEHFTVGHESWSWNTLEEIAMEDCAHLLPQLEDGPSPSIIPGTDLIPLPKEESELLQTLPSKSSTSWGSIPIYVAFTRKRPDLKQLQLQRLSYLGVPENKIHWVSFGEPEDIQANTSDGKAKRDWITKHIWRLANVSGFISYKGILATFSAFRSESMILVGVLMIKRSRCIPCELLIM